ncbi:MAG TPA: hypothetical protein VKA26_14925 [Ignavibacteriaceae bacterium]|nr:hypothetical protein [Ignavibacteriaceae bacterium]
MKKILLFLIFLSIIVYPQEISTPKSLKLKNDVSKIKSEVSGNRFNLQENEEFHKKNVGLAVIYSLLLPGMGELYAGSYSSGKFYTIADGALWGTFIGFNAYGNMRKRDYQAFAASNGGVNNSGKDADFYATIGNYSDVYQYNNEKSLERNFNQIYDENSDYWKWQTTSDRKTYRDMWVSSEGAYNNLRFIVGALILNRIVSVINAVRLVTKYNNQQNDGVSWNISVGLDNKPTLPTSVSFNFQTNF